jgi:MOSC domain-containing protein YiiM
MDELVGRRGMLCRVLRGGTVTQGDPIFTRSPVSSDSASA